MPIKHLLYGKTHNSQVSWCVICDDAGAVEGLRVRVPPGHVGSACRAALINRKAGENDRGKGAGMGAQAWAGLAARDEQGAAACAQVDGSNYFIYCKTKAFGS